MKHRDKKRASSEGIRKFKTMRSSHVALKLLRDRALRLTATFNQMNAPSEQLRSKKEPHCAWFFRRDVGQDLRMQETFSCSCNGALRARGQVLESGGTCPFISWQSLSVKALLTCHCKKPKGLLLSNHHIYSVF